MTGTAFLAGLGCIRLLACGPDFPNNLLDSGDPAVLVAPVANFQNELLRMHLAPPQFHAVAGTNGYAAQSTAAELEDLRMSFSQSGKPAGDAETIAARHLAERAKLQQFTEAMARWKDSAPLDWDASTTNFVRGKPPDPAPEFPRISIPEGLPEEFAEYFSGAIAWENPAVTNKSLAREPWERLLKLPPGERHFKSTWAAFMLGKSWELEDPERAAARFRQTRELARQGFADSPGLAAASLGLEARICLRRQQFEEAIALYLQQMETGDGSAVNSLRFATASALAAGDAAGLRPLAANPKTQRAITAYLISSRSGESGIAPAKKWLEAAEAAGVNEMDSAEELALAAYQAGEWDAAQRWINRAPVTPVAQWLQAKLLLRAGKVEEAGATLAKVVRLFPQATVPRPPAGLQDDLTVARDEDAMESTGAADQVLGELGVFHLTRREYAEALDALLRAGFWMDAAYVAERVLTVDELKIYVDRNWPGATATLLLPPTQRDQIRYLLARRLARLDRNNEARGYYPPDLQPSFDALIHARQTGRDKSLGAAPRAAALLAAAFITRTNGMELLGTEVGPDWYVYGGNFQGGVSAETRTNGNARLLAPSRDELERAAQHGVVPDRRFHYRFIAASLGWEAAKLMPDNSDETALVLCTAGSWIKYLDPEKAGVFYKALVRRCGKTAIGIQADRMRWFPVLDAAGNPVPYLPRPH